MISSKPSIYAHPVSGETLFPILEGALPYSLPLLGRLYFHHRSHASHVLATFAPAPPESTNDASNASEAIRPNCYAVAFLDRTRRPETECWIFVSGEIPGRCSLSSPTKQCDDCKAALLSLVDTIVKLDIPESIHDIEGMMTSNPAITSALRGEVLLIGTIHETLAKIIREALAGADAKPPVKGIDVPYMTYLFRPSTLPEAKVLPAGLHWGAVRTQDFDLVRSRTSIPRQNATLALFPSLAIFRDDIDNGDPVAWAFLGADGSLTSLHTEPEYRGKGLAKILSGKLFREGGFLDNNIDTMLTAANKGERYTSEEAWFHANVALNNKSSRRVCEGLGGKESWVVYWIRIDITRI